MEIKHREMTPSVHPDAGGFLPFVFGTDPAAGRGEQMRTAMRRYARMLARAHRDDE